MDSQASDNALAERAAAGDDQAFAVLVRRHKERLYRLLRRYTDDADEAYEAVHEAFIAAWGALKRYDPDRSFGECVVGRLAVHGQRASSVRDRTTA